jgi:hypothetical protein
MFQNAVLLGYVTGVGTTPQLQFVGKWQHSRTVTLGGSTESTDLPTCTSDF